MSVYIFLVAPFSSSTYSAGLTVGSRKTLSPISLIPSSIHTSSSFAASSSHFPPTLKPSPAKFSTPPSPRSQTTSRFFSIAYLRRSVSAGLFPFALQPLNLSAYFSLVPAQDVHFFYTRSHLSALQNCEVLFSTNFQIIYIFNKCTTQFSH